MRTRNQDQAPSPPFPPGRSFPWSWSWFLILSLGCAPSSTSPAPAAAPADVELEKFVAVQVPYDATLLKAGQWALYRLKVEGLPRTEIFKWSVVGADAKGVWVENKVPHGETGMVRKMRYDRTGMLVEAWMGPPGGVPAKVWPKPGSAPPPARPAVPPAFKETAEPATAAGRVFRCTKVSSEASYPDGRKVAMLSWFCPDVPFAGQARYGGLVRRQIGRVTFELLDAGTGIGRPELEIPK